MINIGTYNKKSVYFDCENALNKHILLLGKSGGGKTVEAQKIMLEIAKNGGTVMALDLHYALAPSQILEKHRSDFALYTNDIDVYQHGISCNLFEPLSFEDGTMEQEVDTIAAITDVFSRILNLGCNQRTALRAAIDYVMRTNKFETEGFAAVGKALLNTETKTSESVHEKLYYFILHNIFRYGDSFLENGKINVIRLGKFALNVQEMVAELLLSYIWRLGMIGKFNESGIYIFVDECQNLPSGKNSLLAQILSEGRKFNINLILATQILMQGSRSVVQQCLTQCGMTLYFQPDASHINTVVRLINPLSSGEWNSVLCALRRGEFIATGALSVGGHRIEKPLKVTAFEKTETNKI